MIGRRISAYSTSTSTCIATGRSPPTIKTSHLLRTAPGLQLNSTPQVPDTSYIQWSATATAREFAANWFVETVSHSRSDQVRNAPTPHNPVTEANFDVVQSLAQLSFALSAARSPGLRVATLPNWFALTDGCEPTPAPAFCGTSHGTSHDGVRCR